MKVLISTDLEGVSGIVAWDKHERGTRLDAWQRSLMTGEINPSPGASVAVETGPVFVVKVEATP